VDPGSEIAHAHPSLLISSASVKAWDVHAEVDLPR
jgi:hypothetical protein